MSACAREPIHIPGTVQSHGALLSVGPDGRVRQASTSVEPLLGRAAAALQGVPLAEAVGGAVADWVAARAGKPGRRSRRFPRLRGQAVWVTAHDHDGLTLVELEPEPPSAPPPPTPAAVRDAVAGFALEPNLFRACQLAAEAVAALAGYDRVMVYMFHPDQTGEVVAEVRDDRAASYLGLRYPASDIPEQARRLYLACGTRQVVNTHTPASPLVPRHDPATGKPLDMGLAVLRPLSPIHLEYLTNMGVAASLTASVVVEGALWGLIACHHNSPRWVDPTIHGAVAAVSEALARVVERDSRWQHKRADAATNRAMGRLKRLLRRKDDVVEELILSRSGLAGTLRADGLALVIGDTSLATGRCPDPSWLTAFARDVAGKGPGLVQSERRARDVPGLPPTGNMAAGFLAQVLDPDLPAVLVAFADELETVVTWGGDPEKAAVWDPSRGRLSPRKSFELWRQTVRGESRPWRLEDVRLMRQVGDALASRVAADRDSLLAQVERLRQRFASSPGLRREVLDALLEGIVLVASVRDDDHMHIHSVNRLFRETFGVGDAKTLPKRLDAFLSKVGLPAELADPAYTTFPLVREVWAVDGGRRWFSMERRTVFNIRSAEGDTRLALISLHDVTPFKQAEQAMDAARRRAEDAMDRQRRFLAAASHELRTPLNAIIGFSEMMTDQVFGPLGNARYEGYAKDVLTSGRHLLSVVNDLLTLARMHGEALAPEGVRTDLTEELRQCCHLVETQVQARGLELEVVLPDQPLWLRVEPRTVRQVLLNLLSNAIKFTPAPGRVTCACGIDPGGPAYLSVADTGIGIADHDQQDVFEPFVRAGNVYTRNTEGTGLGLSIVKALVEAQGGSVQLASRYGQGTTVRAIFPTWLLAS